MWHDMIPGNASDINGIRAEDIKNCEVATREKIRQIFNEVLSKKVVLQKRGVEHGSKSSTKEERRRCRKLSPGLYFACSVKTVLDDLAKQTSFQT